MSLWLVFFIIMVIAVSHDTFGTLKLIYVELYVVNYILLSL
jgi:hypothetical protein